MTRRQREVYSILLSGHQLGIDLSPAQIAKVTAAWGKHAIRTELAAMVTDGIITGVVRVGGSHAARYILHDCPCPRCAR